MTDDLLQRLRAADPAPDETVDRRLRELGDLPAQIASEPAVVPFHRRPNVRRAAVGIAAAVVALALVVPLAVLRPLGGGSETGGTGRSTGPGDGGSWLPVGSLSDLRANHVTYLPELQAFLVAPEGAEPYALVAFPVVHGQIDNAVRVLFCDPAAADNPAGTVFFGIDGLDRGYNLEGANTLGVTQDSLARLPVRVVDGSVQVDPSDVRVEPRHLDPVGPPPDGPRCDGVKGVPFEGEPGSALPAGTALPPIAVALPRSDTAISSPIRVLGSADVFEASVSIRILDAEGTVLADTFTTATCGTGCRGDFDTEVPFSVDREQPGVVQVYESSAKDGSMINVVEIPVTLLPAG